VPRPLSHAAYAAAGAKPALVAGKRQQLLRMALVAHHAQEAILEHTAAQERLEFLSPVLGLRTVFRRKTRNEIRVVRLRQRAQQRALENMASVGRRNRLRGRCGAGIARCRATLQCAEAQHGTLLCIDGCRVFRAASSPPIGVCPVHGWNIGAAQRRKSPACSCCPRPAFRRQARLMNAPDPLEAHALRRWSRPSARAASRRAEGASQARMHPAH